MKHPATMSDRFRILFENLLALDGRPYSLTEIAAGTGIVLNSLSRMKTGKVDDPRLSTMLLLAHFLDISLDYFQCETLEDCYDFLHEENTRRHTLPQIATRVREMSDDVMKELRKMMAYIDQLDGTIEPEEVP